MFKWLLEVIDFYEKPMQHDVNFHSLQRILVVLVVSWDLEFLRDFEVKYYQILFKELCVIPPSMSKQLYISTVEENVLRSDLLRTKVVSIIKWMQIKTVSFKQPIPEILFSFPILHFALRLCVPFADASSLPIINSDTRSALQHFKYSTRNWYVKFYIFL